MSLHYISPRNSKRLTTDTFHCLELIIVNRSCLKYFCLTKRHLLAVSNISKNLQKNRSLKLKYVLKGTLCRKCVFFKVSKLNLYHQMLRHWRTLIQIGTATLKVQPLFECLRHKPFYKYSLVELKQKRHNIE